MWIVNFLPSWFFYILIMVGAAGLLASYVLKALPLINNYTLPVRAGSAVALLLGIWLHGADSNNQSWIARVKEMEEKVAKAEEQSKQANNTINTKIVVKQAAIKQKTELVYRYIDREVTKYDNTCVIPNEFIKAHNDAAEGVK